MNLSSFCLRNFKAIQNSKSIRFTPLTVFIGNNGSGKSSIVEAMETFQSIVLKGLDEAMASWYGFEYILNKAKEHKTIKDKVSSPITFTFHGKSAGKQPGWLLSTGTLRILALLAVLRHPKPPPVIIIEEIENGLDPRTIHLLVDEIRYFVESKRGQVIATTHSPYFLDLLKLSQIVVVERDESGSPVFTRPGSQKSLEDWAQKFSPGKLYTMGKLKRS